MAYQVGGWYNGQQWDGSRLGPKGQVIVGNNNNSSTPTNPAQSYIDPLNTASQQYIDQLTNESKGQLDIALKKIDAQHKLALGNDDTSTAQFLEKVASDLESKVGRIPYDYQKYNNRELQQYAQGNQNIADNKNLALQKLANDQRLADQQMKLQQGNDNQSLVEKLSERGLLGNDKPTGMYQGTNLNGLTGLAGQQAGLQNTDYQNKYDALNSGNTLAQQGVNLDASQQQNALNLNHANTMTDLTDTARRGVQDQQLSDTYNTNVGQNNFDIQKAAYQRQLALQKQNNQVLGENLAGSTQNKVGF